MPSLKSEDNSKDEEPFGLGCALEQFTEHEEISKMIDNLKIIVHEDRSLVEKAYERFLFILGQYKEQPHLLDAHLHDLLEKLVDFIRQPENRIEMKHLCFQYIFVLVNVRGYKVVVRHLPHEVSDLEMVLRLLESQNPTDPNTWTTRYILLLWLSIIVMIPFHMSRFDGFNSGEQTVISRILELIKTYIVVPDKCRDAAAYLSSLFLTRTDVKEQCLFSYFEWTMQASLSQESNIFVKYGTLASVAMILKHGKRDDLLPHASKLLQWIVNEDIKVNAGSEIQKLVYKVIQRVGLVFLPPRTATWRYKRGSRSLLANMDMDDAKKLIAKQNEEEEVENEDIEVPDEVEEIIDQLMQGLRSGDGIVRWSAAKGIGRVTGRLPKDLADEVVGSILELFNPREGDGAWHGGCLALAELGRRGLLLPQRLPEVVPVVLKALIYDEPKGYSSVGSHIRDAACYVCWSFARAYEVDILKPFVNNIAATLLIVACFDREINCRRAASAAFQENVGRQGTFPHGIDILTTADFFAVSVRNNAYLNISVFVAQFDEYTVPLINHLVEKKIDHWDAAIRELSAKALHNLTSNAPDFMVNSILQTLFEKTESIDLNRRHGAVLAIGEIFYALHLIHKRSIDDVVRPELLEKSKELVITFQNRMCFRGMGGEVMRQACCEFIRKCCLASLNFDNKLVSDSWMNLINECLAHNISNVRNSAINALPIFLTQYYANIDTTIGQSDLIRKYIEELASTTSEETRMGHALALGVLPKFILQPNLDLIIDALVESTVIAPLTLKWAEGRRDSIKALTSISVTMKDEIGKCFNEKHMLKIYHVLLEGLKDYTQDKRGDVGAWIREASVSGLQTITMQLTEIYSSFLNEELVSKIFAGIAQQAVEKIDRTRAIAGKVFYNLLYNDPIIPNIPNYEELLKIFVKEECDAINWNSANDTFPKFIELIRFPSLSYGVLLGIVCSVGGLTESLVKNSSSSLYAFLKCIESEKGIEELTRIAGIVLEIFNDYQKVDRVIVPMFRFLDKLFASGYINSIIQNPDSNFAKDTLKLVLTEIVGCKDLYKLIDGINVLCQYIQVKNEVGKSALTQLSILLCHRQSYVRKLTSTSLYEALLIYGDSIGIEPENLDQAMQILSDTNWEDPVDKVRPTRNEICGLMGVKAPVIKKKN